MTDGAPDVPCGTLYLLQRARVLDHEPAPTSLADGRFLREDHLPGLCLGQSSDAHQALAAKLLGGVNEDDDVERVRVEHFEQQRNVVDDDAVSPTFGLGFELSAAALHHRVDDGVQRSEGIAPTGDGVSESDSIQRSVGANHLAAETSTDGGEDGRARCLHLAHQGVGINDRRAPVGEQREYRGFPGGDITGQADVQHRGYCCRAGSRPRGVRFWVLGSGYFMWTF